jgi:hypothetical protein
MANRPIVRNDSISNGRWHFAGSGIFIDAIRRDAAVDLSAARTSYGMIGVTEDEFAAAMAFEFPDLHPASVDVQLYTASIHCSCGIVRTAAIDPTSHVSDPCPCGRRWQLSVGVTEFAP